MLLMTSVTKHRKGEEVVSKTFKTNEHKLCPVVEYLKEQSFEKVEI